MGPGGCDKTQDMIDEWNEKTKDLRESAGVDAAEPGTVWLPHRLYPGSHMLHVKGMFGAVRPIMYRSRIEAERIAKKVDGHISLTKDSKYHIYRTKPLKEDTTPSQLQGLDPSQDVGIVGGPLGEDDPSKKVATIKRVMRAKYKRKLL